MTEFLNELLIIFFDWFELIIILVIGFILVYFIAKPPSLNLSRNPIYFLGLTSIDYNSILEFKINYNRYPAINLSEGVKKVAEYAELFGFDASQSTKISEHFRYCFERVKAVYEKRKKANEGYDLNKWPSKKMENDICDILDYDCTTHLFRFLLLILRTFQVSDDKGGIYSSDLEACYAQIMSIRPVDIDVRAS